MLLKTPVPPQPVAVEHPSLSDVICRALLPEQAPDLLCVLNQVVVEGQFLASQTPFQLPVIERFLTQNQLLSNPQFALWHGSVLIGWCDAVRSPAKAQLARLGMGLQADWRGQGLGRWMLKLLQQHCSALGIEQLELQVFVDNAAAIQLYERCGFLGLGFTQQPMLRAGRPVAVKLMHWSVR